MNGKHLILALLALPVISGCIWGRVKMNDPTLRTRAQLVKVGTTHEADLRRILKAEPTMRMPLRDRTVLGYTYADTKSNGFMLLVVNFMKTQTATDTVYIETDNTGLVQKVSIPPYRELDWQCWPFGD